MEIAFRQIETEDYDDFHALLDAYYRAGEDRDTPKDVVDAFIRMLFDKVMDGAIYGCFAIADRPVGFALWVIDREGGDFSEIPGYGTILEIGVSDEFHKMGIGSRLTLHCEDDLLARGVEWMYVCAYGPAQEFWTRMGYAGVGRIAANGLPILTRRL